LRGRNIRKHQGIGFDAGGRLEQAGFHGRDTPVERNAG
jgi:hypothetical protein